MTTKEIRKMYGSASIEEIHAAYKEVAVDDIDTSDADNTPLHIACANADSVGASILLVRNANPNTQNRYSTMPLHALASAAVKHRYGFPDGEIRKCAEQLFDAHAGVIRKNEQGRTPILEAAYHGCYELLEAAVEKGIKLTATDSEGNTALHLTCRWVGNALESLNNARIKVDKLDQAKLQRLKAEADKAPEDRFSCMMYENELKRHTDAHAEQETKQSIVDGFYLSAKALMDGGLDPMEKNNAGKTPIELAVESGDKRIGALLNGVAPALDSPEAQTGGMSLHQSVVQSDCEAIKACAALGADLNGLCDEGDYKGMTPLAVACYLFDEDAVQQLLELGANPNFKDAEGYTALSRWFKWQGDRHLTMRKANDKLPQKILKTLLAKGYEIDGTVDDKSNTALTATCRSAHQGQRYNNNPPLNAGIAQTLVNARANVNKSNADGQTPLMLICQCARGGESVSELQIMLLEAGAELGATDRNGNTPLHYAAMNTEAGTGKEMAEMLFEFGDPKPDAVNNEGKSALEIAMDNNNEPLVKFILMNS